jgi:hypothetical protein
MRFALKCLPRADARRVVTAEIMRLAVHPTLVGEALALTAREGRQILRERRLIQPTDAFLEWALDGMDAAQLTR